MGAGWEVYEPTKLSILTPLTTSRSFLSLNLLFPFSSAFSNTHAPCELEYRVFHFSMFGTSRNRPLIPEREGSSAVLPAMDYHAARTPDLPIQAKNKGADNVMMTENRDAEKATRPFAGALEENPLDGMSTEERKRAERRLVRKIDLLVMPIACMLYLLAYMDRGVIGNAKLQGLQDDVLGNSSTNYDTAVSVCE